MSKESQILDIVKRNPFISQQDIANELEISRSAVAGYIANLIKLGKIKGRAYILPDQNAITCIGGAHLDRKATCKEAVRLETSNPVSVTESCGGVVRNISENLGRLGCSVSLISCLGDDKEGKWVFDHTSKFGVNMSQVHFSKDRSTGTYTAILDSNGELAIAIADMNIYDEITVPFIMDKWAHIAPSKLVFLDTNLPEDTLFYIIQRCKIEGIPVYVDPVSSKKAKKLLSCLDGIHTILPNLEEAEVLVDMKIESIEDCEKASLAIQKKGVQNIIITLGNRGAFCATSENAVHLPAFPVKTVDVTGTGDAFSGGFLYGIIHEEPFLEACKLGMAAANLTLQTNLSVHPNINPNKLYKVLEENSK